MGILSIFVELAMPFMKGFVNGILAKTPIGLRL
jgi:hypothetical protein